MITIISIYVLSVTMFFNIIINECKENNVPIKFESIFDYYGVDLIWLIFPLVNTGIVLLWYAVKILEKFSDKFKIN